MFMDSGVFQTFFKDWEFIGQEKSNADKCYL